MKLLASTACLMSLVLAFVAYPTPVPIVHSTFLPPHVQVVSSGKAVTDSLREVSVTIMTSHGQGSGVVKTRNGITYVWTAGHVVAGQRRTRMVVDATDGMTKTLVYFEPVMVAQDIIENGRCIGHVLVDAEIVKYSCAEGGEDLAVLRVRKQSFAPHSAQFYLEDEIPFVGTELFHVGSFLGIYGSNSLSRGILGYVGRIISGQVYDQTSCTAFPGSSGGGVFLKDGRYVGMLVRGAGEGMNFIVPIRRMIVWAQNNNLEFLLNDNVPVPVDIGVVENVNEAPEVVLPAMGGVPNGNSTVPPADAK